MLKSLALKFPPIKRLWDDRLALIAARDVLQDNISKETTDKADLLNEVSRLRLEVEDAKSPFYHFNSSFDAHSVMHKYWDKNATASNTHLTNFLGVKIAPHFLPAILCGREGTVETIPIPANWHADIAEWAAALRSVELSKDRFRIIELGCGWGCWLLNTGCAARAVGKSVELIGVEGDLDHLNFALTAMEDNGFSDTQYKIIHGIAAANRGKALFPIVENAGDVWSSSPIFDASAEQVNEAINRKSHHILDTYSISEIAENKPVDLLHIDIQGGEADFIDGCLKDINSLVRYMVIGTHSRQIEGRIMHTLLENGWHLEIERPAIFSIVNGSPRIQVDGVQGWHNPKI